MRLRIESGDESVRANKWENALLCAAGHNPYDLVDSAVAAAAQISGESLLSSCKWPSPVQNSLPRRVTQAVGLPEACKQEAVAGELYSCEHGFKWSMPPKKFYGLAGESHKLLSGQPLGMC